MNKTVMILLIAAVVAVVVLIAVLVTVLKKKKPAVQQENKEPAMPPLDPVIVDGLQTYALRFMGLYEGIYTAVEKQSLDGMDAYREWHIRMENLSEDSRFCEVFAARFPQTGAQLSHLQELLRHIDAAGIRRDGSAFHIADEKTQKQYIYLGSDGLTVGKEYKVLKPCWLQNDTVVEQGFLSSKEGL